MIINKIKSIAIFFVFILLINISISAETTDVNYINFLDIESAKEAIIDDANDPYFSRLQPMEMSAKTGSAIDGNNIEQQRQNCRQRYQSSVLNFTEPEKEIIKRSIETIEPVIRENYPLYAEIPWSFIKISNNIEGGMAHTRDKYIVLSENYIRRFSIMQSMDSGRNLQSMIDLLIHEQMHVFQRMNPEKFDSLYNDIWGFIKAQQVESYPWLDEHQLINPDGTDCRWIFQINNADSTTYVLPLVVFAEGQGLKRMPRDFRMIAVEMAGDGKEFRPKIDEDDKPVYRNLMEVQEYRGAFPYTTNIYHPNETCASLFSIIVLADFQSQQGNISNRPAVQEEVIEPLREWFIENLKKEPVLEIQQ